MYPPGSSKRQAPSPLSGIIAGDTSDDVTLPLDAQDSISEISWSPTANNLAVASWDQKVRIYDIAQTKLGPESKGIAYLELGGPVLSCDWSRDGKGIVAAGVDQTARVLDLTANGAPAFQVAAHDAPIRSVRFFNAPNSNASMVVTGSWDRTIKYWDLRQSTPVASVGLSERVHTMDLKDKLLVIGTANREIHMVNLNNPTAIWKTMESPLRRQTRTVTCKNDGSCVGIGSIEGRCAIVNVDEKQANSNFSFRCHRDSTTPTNTDVWAVNAVSFHPVYGTLSTAGSDGSFHIWDLVAHSRLKAFPSVGGAITSTDFNREGSLFAYAVSYDWSQGFAKNTPQYPTKVMLHTVGDEVKPRPIQRRRY